nr:MAG TPA: hypothetical protein [Caudoviricetes sp.]
MQNCLTEFGLLPHKSVTYLVVIPSLNINGTSAIDLI